MTINLLHMKKIFLVLSIIFISSCSDKIHIFEESEYTGYELYTSDYSHLALIYLYNINDTSGCRIEINIYETSDVFIDLI